MGKLERSFGVEENLEARTYKRARAVGVSPFAEVHPREDSGVAGDARVSGSGEAGRQERREGEGKG